MVEAVAQNITRTKEDRALLVPRFFAFVALSALPSYVVRYDIPIPIKFLGHHFIPTTMLESFILATIASWLIVKLFFTAEGISGANYLTIPAILLFIAGCISVADAPNLREALGQWRAVIVEPLIMFFIILDIYSSEFWLNILLIALAISGLVAVLPNMAVVINALVHHKHVVAGAPVVIYTTPNAVSLLVDPLLAIAVALAMYDNGNVWRRRIATVLAIVFALGDFLTFSRGGWVAVAVALVVIAFFHPRRLRIYAGLVVLAILALALPPVRHRVEIELNFHSKLNSVVTRIYLWESTLRMLRARPFTGSGLAGFQYWIAKYKVPQYNQNLIDPHDIFLNFWAHTGLLGLIAGMWSLIIWGYKSFVNAIKNGPQRAMQIGLFAAAVAIFVHGLVDVPYFKNDLAVEWWALAAVQLISLRLAGIVKSPWFWKPAEG